MESLVDPLYVDIRLPYGALDVEKEKALRADSKELCMMLEKLFSIRTHATTAGFDCHTTCIEEMIQETTLLMGKTARRLARVRGAARVVVQAKPPTDESRGTGTAPGDPIEAGPPVGGAPNSPHRPTAALR